MKILKNYQNFEILYHLLRFYSAPKHGHVISIILLSPTKNDSHDLRMIFLEELSKLGDFENVCNMLRNLENFDFFCRFLDFKNKNISSDTVGYANLQLRTWIAPIKFECSAAPLSNEAESRAVPSIL